MYRGEMSRSITETSRRYRSLLRAIRGVVNYNRRLIILYLNRDKNQDLRRTRKILDYYFVFFF